MEFKMRLDKKSYDIGFEAGKKLEECDAPAGVDELSWYSGYIEGKAQGKLQLEDQHTLEM